MSAARCRELLKDADAVINLCIATKPREEHHSCRRLVYLETDPGPFQVSLGARRRRGSGNRALPSRFFHLRIQSRRTRLCAAHRQPSAGIAPVRRCCSTSGTTGVGPAEPALFTTVGTWTNRGKDVEIDGEKYWWSKHVNFRQVLDVARLAGQPIELATDLDSGPDYERALAGGFTIRPVIPMSLDLEGYREYISASRGEFTLVQGFVCQDTLGMVQRPHRHLSWPRGGRSSPSIPGSKNTFLPAPVCWASTMPPKRSTRCADQRRLPAPCQSGARTGRGIFRRRQAAGRDGRGASGL